MIYALRIIFFGLLAVWLSGCAAPEPRYQATYRYEPPAEAAGRACLETPEHKLAQCQQRCTADYQACQKRIEPQVEIRFAEALKRYQTEMKFYRWELDRYQRYLSMSWGWPAWSGSGFYYPRPEPYCFPPEPPTQPSRDREFGRLRQENCEMNCGCQAIYDAGFLSCGGKLIPEVKCIANCPAGK